MDANIITTNSQYHANAQNWPYCVTPAFGTNRVLNVDWQNSNRTERHATSTRERVVLKSKFRLVVLEYDVLYVTQLPMEIVAESTIVGVV